MIAQTLRKALASVSAAAVLLTTAIVPGMSVNFVQAQPGHWGYDMYETSYFDLDAVEESFGDNLNANITRGEYTRMVLIVSGLEVGPLTIEEAGIRAADLGILFGQNNDSTQLGLNEQLNRAEAVTIVRRAFAELEQYPANASLSDLDVNAWYGMAFQQSIAGGVIVGRVVNGVRQALPAGTLTRAEGMALAYQAFRAVEALLAWEAAGNSGVPSTDDITALEALAVFNLEVEYSFSEVVENPDNNEEPLPAGGTLLVELSAMTPRSQNIPQDAASVVYTAVDFTATGGDVAVTSFTIQRYGLGDDEDFDDMWGTDADGVRITAQRGLTFTDRVELPFQPALLIRSGQTVTVYVNAELSGTAGSGRQNSFGINSASDISATGTVSGTFPLMGNELEVANYKIGSVALQVQGTARTIDVGDTEVEFGEFQITDESDENNSDICLVAITFELEGSVDREDLANVALYRANERVSEVVSEIPESERVTFRFLPTLDRNGVEVNCFFIADGNNRTFTIRGDLVSGTEGDTVTFEFDNSSDAVIRVIGLTGYQPRIVGTTNFAVTQTTLNNLQLRTQTINAGDLAFAQDPSSPDVKDWAPDSDDVTALILRVSTPVAVEVKSVNFNVNYTDNTAPFFAGAASAANTAATIDASLDNFRLVLLESNGQAVSGASTLASTATLAQTGGRTLASEQSITTGAASNGVVAGSVGVGTVTFSDDFTMPAGVHLVAFVLDIEAAAPATDQFSVQYAGASGVTAEYVENGDLIVANRITGGATVGATFTINTATLVFSEVSGTPVNDPLVRGTLKALIMTMNVNNNDVEPVEITDMVFSEGAANTLVDMTVINNCFVAVRDASGSMDIRGEKYRQVSEVDDYDDANITTNANATMTFDQVSVIIDTNNQATLYLFCDIATSAVTGTGNFQAALTSVTSEDEDGDAAGNVAGNPATAIAVAAPLNAIARSISAGGTLTIAIDSNTTDTDILVGDGGGVEQSVAVVRFSAEDDEIAIKDLVMNITRGVFTQRVSKVLLYSMDKSVLYDEATVVASTALPGQVAPANTNIAEIAFSMASTKRINIAKDKNTRVLVAMIFNDITEISQSHKLLRLYLDESFITSGTEPSVEAVSRSTGQDLQVQTIAVNPNTTGNSFTSTAVATGGQNTAGQLETYTVGTHPFQPGQTIFVTNGTNSATALVEVVTATTVTVNFTAAFAPGSAIGDVLRYAVAPTAVAAASPVAAQTTLTVPAGHGFDNGDVISFYDLSAGAVVTFGAGNGALANVTATTITYVTADFPGVAGGVVVGDLVLKTSSQTLASDDFYLYASKVTVTRASLNDSTLNFNNSDELYRFKATADAAGDIDIAIVTLEVSQTDTNVDTFVIKEVNSNGTVIQNPVISRSAGSTASAANLSVGGGTTVPGAGTFNVVLPSVDEYVIGSAVLLAGQGACDLDTGTAGTGHTMVGTVTAIDYANGVAPAGFDITVTTVGSSAGIANCGAAGDVTVRPYVGTDSLGNELKSGLVRMVFLTSKEAAEGTSQSYQVEARTADAGGQDFNSVSVQLKEETTVTGITVGTSQAIARLGANFVWSDEPNTAQHINHTWPGPGNAINPGSSADFLNGDLVDNLPTTGAGPTN